MEEMEGEKGLLRLRSISDQIRELKANLPYFPTNQSYIDDLERERKELIGRYVRAAPPYP
jgi:uncharacterized protein involved in exopolysaccharide biosynthesis